MNVLISSVGRQSFLVKEFQEALDKQGKVVVTDYDETAKAFKVADKHYTSPAYEDKNYIPWLLNICRIEEIDLLFTLNVDDLIVIEENRSYFKDINCFIVGGNLESIKITYDKYLLYKFCLELNIDTPSTFLLHEISNNDNVQFPIIAKPRIGKGSRGNFIINNRNELKTKLEENKELFSNESYIFQELINGDEYGVDLINDFNSNFQTAFIRKKLRMKNGETFEAITSPNENWLPVAKLLSKELQYQGIIDLDFMLLEGKKYLIDINHRFGGGYIFSHTAGAEMPKVFVNWFLEKDIEPGWLKPVENIHCRRNDFGAEIISDEK